MAAAPPNLPFPVEQEEEKRRVVAPSQGRQTAAPPVGMAGFEQNPLNQLAPSQFGGAQKLGTFRLASPGDITPDTKIAAGLAPNEAEKEILQGNSRWDKIHSETIKTKYNEMNLLEKQAREGAALGFTASKAMTVLDHGLPVQKPSLEELLGVMRPGAKNPAGAPPIRLS